MGARIESKPLTLEDVLAWSYCYGFIEGDAWDVLMIDTRLADRRDADLMGLWQLHRAIGSTARYDTDSRRMRIYFRGEDCPLRGADRLT